MTLVMLVKFESVRDTPFKGEIAKANPAADAIGAKSVRMILSSPQDC